MLRLAVLALTVFTGFSGLAYEVTWQKYLATLLGAHSEATASVLAIFLGGLSLGYWLFGVVTRQLVERGRRSGQPPPLLQVYGAVEIAIGVYCLSFPALFRVAHVASVQLPSGVGGLPFLAEVALSAALIGPPAVLMGSTIPILTQALARSLADATRFHALVYACNTAGAVAGALGAGFVLIPWLGFDGVMRSMSTINLASGLTFVLLGQRRREVAALDAGPGARPPPEGLAIYGAAALLVGFAMMAVQTILIRIGGLSFGSSEFTFSMVVAVFVLCIAVGSLLVSAFPRIDRRVLPGTLWVLALLLALLYIRLDHAPYWAHLVRTMFRDQPQVFYTYHAVSFLGMLVLIGPVVVLSGATLPLLFDAVRREVGELGARAGWLYSLNTVGSLLGALLGGYLLLFWLDLHHVYRIAVGAILLGAALVSGRLYARRGLAAVAAAFFVSILVIGVLPAWRPELLASGFFRIRRPMPWSYVGPEAAPRKKLFFYDDDPTSSVAVAEHPDVAAHQRSILVNGKSDGNTQGDLYTMGLAAIVPSLFAERVERSFVIGFGTGVTVGQLAAFDEARSVTVAEISPAVIEAAPLFDFANLNASRNPKIQVVRSDAFRALLKSDEHYDVIVSEPSNPWVTGVEMLFSREFLETARDRLTPGGVYAQWYHLYETDNASVRLVLRTYAAVFDHIAVWVPQSNDLLLLGFKQSRRALDLARFEKRAKQPDFSAALARLGIEDLPSLLVHEALPLDVVNALHLEGPLHTLYHPLLSFEAGRAFFRGGAATLPFTGYGEPARIGFENSLLRRYLSRFDGRIPEETRRRMVREACNQGLQPCPTLLGDWSRERPASPAFKNQLTSVRHALGPDSWVRFLPRVRVFLGDPLPAVDQLIAPADALRANRQYRLMYYHPFPFHPAALVAIWERCGRPELIGPQCRRGLQAAYAFASGSGGALEELPESLPERAGSMGDFPGSED